MKTTAGKTRTVARGTRPIRILHVLGQYEREYVTEVQARNLPEALRLFHRSRLGEPGFFAPFFQGNTLTVGGMEHDEVYVAVDR